MKRLQLIIVLLSVTAVCGAQEMIRSTVGVSGSTAVVENNGNERIVQQSVGQSSVIGTFKNGSMQIRQGFVQPPISVEGVFEDDTNLDATIYPNPVESVLTVVLNETVTTAVDFVLYDMLGRVVHTQKLPAQEQLQLDMTKLSSAQYILLITAGNKQFKANLIKR
ncbi:MAG: T9SS type A sorting domain-containing protein [Dokdonia sp.]|jgi:hypothetical protein